MKHLLPAVLLVSCVTRDRGGMAAEIIPAERLADWRPFLRFLPNRAIDPSPPALSSVSINDKRSRMFGSGCRFGFGFVLVFGRFGAGRFSSSPNSCWFCV